MTEFLTSAHFRQLVEAAHDVIVVTEAAPLDEPGPRIVYVNAAFTRLTGYTAEEVIGRSPRFLQKTDLTDTRTTGAVREALEHEAPFDGPILNFAKDGSAYWLDMHIFPLRDGDGNVTHFAAIERDVTARTLREIELRSAANTDPLTGLFNRRGLEQIVLRAWHPERTNSVVLIDLDRFKSVNDDHGHAVGDHVLVALSEAIIASMRESDYPVRLGGDEFGLVLLDTPAADAARVAQRVRAEFQEALRSAGLPQTTFSAGVAAGGHEGMQQVFARADDALSQAKGSGRDRHVVHVAGVTA